MAGRNPYKYRLKHDLERFIRLKQAQRVLETGEPITQSDIKDELIRYVGISKGTLVSFLNKSSSPSLIVGMAIAEYFNAKVEDIFSIEPIDDGESITKESDDGAE